MRHYHFENGETIVCYKTHQKVREPVRCPCCGEQFELVSIFERDKRAHYCETVHRWMFSKCGVITVHPSGQEHPGQGELSPG